MNVNRMKKVILAGLFLGMLFSQVIFSASREPLELIKNRNQTITQILDKAGEKVDDATREKLKDIINNLIDFRELSRQALGKYWDERPDAEKEEFVDVFRQLIRNSSVKKLEIYRADKIEYKEPEIEDDKATVTTVAYKDRKSVEIVYKMHKVSGEWKIYDIVIDDVSTARNYRSSFYKQIEKTSFREMLDKLKERLEKEA